VASGVNANGDVVGFSMVPDNSTSHATLWLAGTHALVDLNPAGAAYSEAVAINAAGDIVGSSMDVNYVTQPILWTGANHVATVLQTLGGKYGLAYGINGNGDIVGQSQNASGVMRPTLWSGPSHTPVDLGTPVAGAFGVAYGINASGDIAGYSATADGSSRHGTLWQVASVAGSPSTCKLSASSKSQDRSRSDNRSRSDERRRAEERERDRQWLGLSSSSSKPSTAAAPTAAASSPVVSSSTGARTVVDLGILAGANSQAASVNTAGKIVGYGENLNWESRAMFWQATPSVPVPPTGTPGRDHEGNHENRGQEEGDC
jgi:uncharacterized membrane protein